MKGVPITKFRSVKIAKTQSWFSALGYETKENKERRRRGGGSGCGGSLSLPPWRFSSRRSDPAGESILGGIHRDAYITPAVALPSSVADFAHALGHQTGKDSLEMQWTPGSNCLHWEHRMEKSHLEPLNLRSPKSTPIRSVYYY